MARSPAVASPGALPTRVPAKSKPIAALQTKSSAASSPRDSEDEDAPEDLAERLNWEEKHKYVKGSSTTLFDEPMITSNDITIGKTIGEGTYANVYKGHLRSDPSTLVAIKKIKVIKEFQDGIAPAAFRECKYLSELSHPNIIHLLGVFTSKDQNINLVLEYLPMGDLEAIIKAKDSLRYSAADIKAWMLMVNRAVWWCHENHILHRDIKPNNIFVAADGTLKLADFGLARSMIDPDPRFPMTTNVITMFYRPPELLYETKYYTGKVDIWSVGCVHAELLLGTFFLPCEREIQLLDMITSTFGHPTERNWPGVSKLKEWASTTGTSTTFTPLKTKHQLMPVWRTNDEVEADLLFGMFQLDPQKRFSARQVLEHDYWGSKPRPTEVKDLPRKGGGEAKMGEDLKRSGGEIEEGGRGDKVARKLNFG
jgi:cyclin-dependent kinase 7